MQPEGASPGAGIALKALEGGLGDEAMAPVMEAPAPLAVPTAVDVATAGRLEDVMAQLQDGAIAPGALAEQVGTLDVTVPLEADPSAASLDTARDPESGRADLKGTIEEVRFDGADQIKRQDAATAARLEQAAAGGSVAEAQAALEDLGADAGEAAEEPSAAEAPFDFSGPGDRSAEINDAGERRNPDGTTVGQVVADAEAAQASPADGSPASGPEGQLTAPPTSPDAGPTDGSLQATPEAPAGAPDAAARADATAEAAKQVRFAELKTKAEAGQLTDPAEYKEYRGMMQEQKQGEKIADMEAKAAKGDLTDDEFAQLQEMKRKRDGGTSPEVNAANGAERKTPEQEIQEIDAKNAQIQKEMAQHRQDLMDPKKAENAAQQLRKLQGDLDANNISKWGHEVQQMARKRLESGEVAGRVAKERIKEIQRLQAEQLALVYQLTEAPRKQLKALQVQKDEAKRERKQRVDEMKRAQNEYQRSGGDPGAKARYEEATESAMEARGKYIGICAKIVDYSTSGMRDIQIRIDQLDNQIALKGGEQGILKFVLRGAIHQVRRYINDMGVQGELDAELQSGGIANPGQSFNETARRVV
jgi:hypothetical protein